MDTKQGADLRVNLLNTMSNRQVREVRIPQAGGSAGGGGRNLHLCWLYAQGVQRVQSGRCAGNWNVFGRGADPGVVHALGKWRKLDH